MNARPVTPKGSVGGFPLAPWLIVAGCAAAYALVALGWLAGRIAAVIATGRWHGPSFGWGFVETLMRGDARE